MVKAREPQSPPPAAESPVSRAERPLKLLIAAAVVFPIAIFAVVAWISYSQHIDEARDRLQPLLKALAQAQTELNSAMREQIRRDSDH